MTALPSYPENIIKYVSLKKIALSPKYNQIRPHEKNGSDFHALTIRSQKSCHYDRVAVLSQKYNKIRLPEKNCSDFHALEETKIPRSLPQNPVSMTALQSYLQSIIKNLSLKKIALSPKYNQIRPHEKNCSDFHAL